MAMKTIKVREDRIHPPFTLNEARSLVYECLPPQTNVKVPRGHDLYLDRAIRKLDHAIAHFLEERDDDKKDQI